jgi:hypothetical protein
MDNRYTAIKLLEYRDAAHKHTKQKNKTKTKQKINKKINKRLKKTHSNLYFLR